MADVTWGVPPPPACLACLQDHRTPLHIAARNGDEASCRMLIEQRADVNARDKVMGVG